MKYSEAKKAIEALSSKYSINVDEFFKYFDVNYKGLEIAYVDHDERYAVGVWSSEYFSKLPFSNKLYMILSELAMTPLDKRADEKKYFIHVFEGSVGYLNVNISMSKTSLDNSIEMPGIETKFTLKEIERLKQREDVPLDWKKVKLEEAE